MKNWIIVPLGAALIAACGETTTQRTSTGAVGGAAAGAVVGGPVGAVVGAGVGGATGAYREQIEDRADSAVDRQAEKINSSNEKYASTTASTGMSKAASDDLTNEQVRQAQESLQTLGYYDGEIDGLYGSQTIAAVGEFQENEGLPPTYALDSQTMNSLETQTAEAPAATQGQSSSGEGNNAPARSDDMNDQAAGSNEMGDQGARPGDMKSMPDSQTQQNAR